MEPVAAPVAPSVPRRLQSHERVNSSMFATRKRAQARQQLEEETKKALSAELQPKEIIIQYLQSLLVWNLWSHLLSLMILIYLATYYVEQVMMRLEVFQTVGVVMMFASVVPTLRHMLSKKVVKRAAKASKEGGGTTIIAWPADAVGESAELAPLSLHTFTGRVKLYDFDTLMHMMAEWGTLLLQAQRSLRLLRFRNPTLFMLNMLLVVGVCGVMSSFVSGSTLFLIVVYTALLLPGFLRRRIREKIMLRLWRTARGRQFVRLISVGENLNLEETNTSNVLAFIGDLGEAQPARVAKVSVKAVEGQ